MRRFKLINAEGSSFDLNSRTAFFHSVEGFGYKDNTQYEQIGTAINIMIAPIIVTPP